MFLIKIMYILLFNSYLSAFVYKVLFTLEKIYHDISVFISTMLYHNFVFV